MPITLWPANAVSGAPSYSGRMLRQALGVLLGGATSSRPLGGRSGVRPGTSGLGSATSTVWTVNPHAGALDLESSTAAGPYLYSVDDTSNTGTVTAADATNPRVDLVYVTLNDPAEGDGSSAPGAVFGYVAGTPADSPTTPATPARSMALFTISVPKSGTGSPTTTDVAPFTSAAGAAEPVRSQAERDALVKYDGRTVFRLDTGGFETCYGGVWGEPYINVCQKSAATAPTQNVWTVLAWDTVIENNGLTYSGGVFTVLKPGVYAFKVQFTFTSSTPVVQIGAAVATNASPPVPYRRNFGSSMTGANAAVALDTEYRFAAGQQFTLPVITAASGHALETASTGAGTFASVRWVGP
ncbi:MAG: hypothetical protein ACXVX9_05665 [Mycobacteriaceae bacterium]